MSTQEQCTEMKRKETGSVVKEMKEEALQGVIESDLFPVEAVVELVHQVITHQTPLVPQ